MFDSSELLNKLDSIVLFRGVTNGEVLSSLRRLLESSENHDRIRLYADFVSELFRHGYDFGSYLMDAVSEDENDYIKLRSEKLEIPAVLENCAREELKIFSELSEITSKDLREFTGYQGYLPEFETTSYDFVSEYERRALNVGSTGYGIYAKNVMFRVVDGEITPLRSPDKTKLSHLIGYESQREQLIGNTLAFLENRPCANTLLYGDAGTGKSSSVKAVANYFAPKGLRLIEVRKEQLRDIPHIMESVRDNPLKFIIFIDDLSFSADDDNFSALKAILEGSASVQSPNTVIYVTSNRRHLVKESFSDRDGDDIHRGDTMQEQISMSERFGLVILFTKPSKQGYLEIVKGLFDEMKLEWTDEVEVKACAFALRKGGFTPRAAEQFVDQCAAEQMKIAEEK
ncbi:MAG: ATP-binding protein [Oscillospiraceae bacterium]|nr:ATP-binding protein [Oscillospiraceae bacterium]